MRRPLVKEKGMKKYILYAFGEILLVMVGILLALQVNNWNEDRLARNLERLYLQGLFGEFETNLEELKSNMAVNSYTIEIARRYLDLTGPDASSVPPLLVSSLFDSLLRTSVEYEPSPGVLEDIISSGNLKLLTNDSLRMELSNWKAKLARASRQEQTVLGYRSNIKQILIDKGTLRIVLSTLIDEDEGRFDDANIDVLEHKPFENNLSFFIISAISLNEVYYSQLKEINENLLVLIRKQIE